MELGETVQKKGYVTQLHYLKGRSATQLERLLGYKAGRLAGGWALLELLKMPKPEDFEFRGYSYFSGGIEEGHLDSKKSGNTAEVKLRDGSFDLNALKLALIKNSFAITGPRRLVKVCPKDPPSGIKDYPPGSGVPQWELVNKLSFRVTAVMLPEGRTWEK